MVGKTLVWTAGVVTAACACVEITSWTQATLRTWLVATVGAVLVSTVVGAEPGVNAEIAKAADRYRLAVLAGDAQAVAATYVNDGTELPPGHPMVRGRSAIEARFRELFQGAKVTAFTFSHLETTADGDIAYDAGTYEQRLTLSSGQTVADSGKFVAVLRRVDRDWKAAYVIYNSDVAPPSPCASR
jgi:uncharacterized protein (TIGR02246 family)